MTDASFQSIEIGVAAHIGRYADAVRVPAGHDVIYLSGTPGLDETGAVPPEFGDEARQAWVNVEKALAGAGATLADVVNVRQWLTRAEDIPAYAAVRNEFIKHKPTFMLGVIPGLVWPGIHVEVEVTAVRRSS